MTNNKEISKHAQQHILKNKETANKMGTFKGLAFSRAIKRILCRKCLSRIMREFGEEIPNPENPLLYCDFCRPRIAKLTKDTYEVE